jgi:hypothetical protein
MGDQDDEQVNKESLKVETSSPVQPLSAGRDALTRLNEKSHGWSEAEAAKLHPVHSMHPVFPVSPEYTREYTAQDNSCHVLLELWSKHS